MASKVLIKLPVPFSQQIGGKELVREAVLPFHSADPLLRVTHLEQNIKFLQEQHQSMLASLHEEIESLRVKNRDLQFQLIFGKSVAPIFQSSSDSSPEDCNKPKVLVSPKEVNTQSLQVEILEREVSELKINLTEANNKNTSLNQLIEQQRKQIDSLRKEQQENDYVIRLEEADNLIKRLIRENDDQQKEISVLRNQLRNQNGGGRGGRRGDHHMNQQRFPPLQGHNYWPHRHRNSGGEYGGGLRGDEDLTQPTASTLPHLNRGGYSQPHNRTRYFSKGNQFYQGNNMEEREGRRKYRGAKNGSHQQ